MKGGTKIIAFVTICIILLSISFSGCFEEEKDDHSYYIFYYELSLISNNNDTSYVYFPVPINDYHNTTSNIIEELMITNGNGTFSVFSSNYGTCLNISFNNTISLSVHMKIYDKNSDEQSYYFFDDLSLKKEYYDYYIYSNHNITINKFYSYVEHNGERDDYRILVLELDNERISIGWNIVNFRY